MTGLLVSAYAQESATPKVSASIGRVGDATHLEILGRATWDYEIKRTGPKTFQIKLPSLDGDSLERLKAWRDELISAVKVVDQSMGTVVLEVDLKDSRVESFDYLTDQPSRLIVDFYRLQTETPPSSAELKLKTQKEPAANRTGKTKISQDATKGDRTDLNGEGYRKIAKAAKDRRGPAGSETLQVEEVRRSKLDAAPVGLAFDAADPNFNRFRIKNYQVREDALIANKKNIYIRFPVLRMPYSVLPELAKMRPEYEIRPRDDRENKEARFLLALYERHLAGKGGKADRLGAFLKAYDHFIKTYPDSEYDEIIRNLAAEMLQMRFDRDGQISDLRASLDLFKYLVSRYPNSVLAERNHLWIAFTLVSRGEALNALQELQDYVDRHRKTQYRFQVDLAVAEAYLKLRKYPEALKVYDQLVSQSSQERERAEAEFRRGDVFMEQRMWQDAEKAYLTAFQKFPQYRKVFPSGLHNLAEAQFQMRQHKSSLDHYIEFLQNFPDHHFGGYAMTRIGENLEALGADTSQVVGAFLETYFRYHRHPGSDIARVRMLSQQMRSMKEKELRKTLAELKEIESRSNLERIQEFISLMIADGYQRRGEHSQALKELIGYYQMNPNTADLELFRSRILRNMAELIQSDVQRGAFADALRFYDRYSQTWLKQSNRLDISFLVAEAYEQAGAYEEAGNRYGAVLEKLKALQGSDELKARKVEEILPHGDGVRLRMAAVATKMRRYPEAYLLLVDLKPEALSEAEKLERVQLSADVAEAKGDLVTARKFLQQYLDSSKADPGRERSTQVRLAELELKAGSSVVAEKLVDQVLAANSLGESVDGRVIARAYEIKGRSLEAQGKELAAVEAYQKLLEGFEGRIPLATIRFRTGEILFRMGDLVGAERVWSQLDAGLNPSLSALAKARLADARWEQEYKKYVNRIPAMAPAGSKKRSEE